MTSLETGKKPEYPGAKKSRGYKEVVFVAVLVGLTIGYFKYRKPIGADVQSGLVTHDTEQVLVKTPDTFFTSQCLKLSFTLQDKGEKETNKSGVLIRIKDEQGKAITLFQRPGCKVDGLPVLVVQLPPGKTQQDLYFTTDKPGPLTIDASNLKDAPLPVRGPLQVTVMPNPRAFKIEYSQIPKTIVEMDSFEVLLSVKDTDGKDVEESELPLTLALLSDDPEQAEVVLGETKVKGGKAELKKLFVRELRGKSFKFSARMGDSDVVSTPMPKGDFVPRAVTIQLLTGENKKLVGKFIRPKVVELFGDFYTIYPEGSKEFVNYKGTIFEAEIVSADLILLRKVK